MSSQTPPCSKRQHYRCDICQENFYEYESLLVHQFNCNKGKDSHLQPLDAELLCPDLTQATGAPVNQSCLDGSMPGGTSPGDLMQEIETDLQSLSVELLSPGLTQATEVPVNQSCLDGSMPGGTSPGDLMQEFDDAILLKKKALQHAYESAMKANELAKATQIIKSQMESALRTLKEERRNLQLARYSNASEEDILMARERFIDAKKAAKELSVKEKDAIAELENSAIYQRTAIEKAVEASKREQSAFKAAVAALTCSQRKNVF